VLDMWGLLHFSSLLVSSYSSSIVLAPLPAAFPMPISVPIRSRSVVTNNELLISVDVVLVFTITAFYNLDRG